MKYDMDEFDRMCEVPLTQGIALLLMVVGLLSIILTGCVTMLLSPSGRIILLVDIILIVIGKVLLNKRG